MIGCFTNESGSTDSNGGRDVAFNWSLPPRYNHGYQFGMASKPLRDSDVRQAAYRRLLTHAQACPDTLVIDELGLDHGSCKSISR